jgi:hypothetical protein
MSTTNVASAILTICLILPDDFIHSSFSLCNMELAHFSAAIPSPQTNLTRAQKEA